jgi:hypothetical protein
MVEQFEDWYLELQDEADVFLDYEGGGDCLSGSRLARPAGRGCH